MSFLSQSAAEPPADRPGLRVPDTRELEQLLYAGRQRAGAFLSPEKNSTLTFSVDYKETGKPCCTT